jgi:uncharacterized membrane protein (DUF2068 family)
MTDPAKTPPLQQAPPPAHPRHHHTTEELLPTLAHHAAAHHRAPGLDAIILYKLVKSVFSALVGILALATLQFGAEALSATLAQVLLDHVARAWALQVATLIVVAGTTAHVRLAAVAAFADSSLSAVEGLALRAGHWWAPWLVVVATGALLPWELFELVRNPRWGRLLILLLNLLVVAYLLYGVVREHREKRRAALVRR